MVAQKPTRVAVGSLRAGHVARLANRKGTELSAAWVTVTDAKPEDIAEGKPGYRVSTADGEYGHFPASAKFELQPAEVAKAETTPTQAAKATAKGPRVSPSLKRAVEKLITEDGERGSLVRSELKEDPMVLVAGERRGWFEVDRKEGNDRKADLVTLTEDGFKAALAMKIVVPGTPEEKADPVEEPAE